MSDLRTAERVAAEAILDRPHADPDDDAAVCARAALRLGSVRAFPPGSIVITEKQLAACLWEAARGTRLEHNFFEATDLAAAIFRELVPEPPSYIEVRTTACHAGSDGDCSWAECPQNRDGEPVATGRHCPLDRREGSAIY